MPKKMPAKVARALAEIADLEEQEQAEEQAEWVRKFDEMRAKRDHRTQMRKAAIALVTSGQATVAEAAHLADTSRQNVQNWVKEQRDPACRTQCVSRDGTPLKNMHGDPMMSSDITQARTRYLQGLWDRTLAEVKS